MWHEGVGIIEHQAVYDKLGQELHQTQLGEDEIGFAIRQIKRVHECWSTLPVSID